MFAPRNLNTLFSLPILMTLLLTGCGVFGATVSEPPLPTIVAATETPPVDPTSSPLPPTAPPTEAESDAQVAVELAPGGDPPATPTELPPSPTSSPLSPTATSPSPAQLPALDAITLRLDPVADGFTKPLYLTHAGDGSGRLFVVEQAGRIMIIENGAMNPTPFLDIVSIVGSSGNEQGLLSVAFHPNYPENGRLFVDYTNQQGDTEIAQYTVSSDPNQADPNSGELLLTIDQPYRNHNGGQLVFGPDGYLYIGMGDGGSANDPENRAQNLGALLGKILRLDVDNAAPYGVPADNPFVGNDQARPEIWSYGWRNPWRISFDRATGDMYVGDVGQNQYEEIDFEAAGAPGGQNYGWRLMEGLHCFNPSSCDPAALGLVLPVAEYDHGQGCSVTGGYAYRGQQFPNLDGIYFYGDYCTGLIWGLRREADGSWSQAQLLSSDRRISSFGEDETGEVYLVDQSGAILSIGGE